MSRYIGVYDNNYAPTKEETPYRVAIKRYVNSKPEYINIGYFASEDVAAYIYNIYALSYFGKGAVINDVQPDYFIEEAVMEYAEERPEFNRCLQEATEIAEAYMGKIKVHVSEE